MENAYPPHVSALLQSPLHGSNARAIGDYAEQQESMEHTLSAYAMAVGCGLPQDIQKATALLQEEASNHKE